MKTLIIGAGEVGTGLYNVLSKTFEVEIIDKEKVFFDDPIEIMHICFSYSNRFIREVQRYQKLYEPKYTVIHSTVPVGTSTKCNATHSPIRGVHPKLTEGIEKFVKFVGGKDADIVSEYFRRAGMKVQLCRKSETTELAKILCTTRYGIDIEYAKETERLCFDNNVPYAEVYTLWNQTYNKGYRELNEEQYLRPILQPIQSKIGGHCVLPNTNLIDTEFTKLIKRLNDSQ